MRSSSRRFLIVCLIRSFSLSRSELTTLIYYRTAQFAIGIASNLIFLEPSPEGVLRLRVIHPRGMCYDFQSDAGDADVERLAYPALELYVRVNEGVGVHIGRVSKQIMPANLIVSDREQAEEVDRIIREHADQGGPRARPKVHDLLRAIGREPER